MATAWDVLRDAGVPDGAVRRCPAGPLDGASLTAALHAVAAHDALQPFEHDCLAAWLAAFRHHWPDRFAALLGPTGERVLEECAPATRDPNRYLKLRRIAVENLSQRV